MKQSSSTAKGRSKKTSARPTATQHRSGGKTSQANMRSNGASGANRNRSQSNQDGRSQQDENGRSRQDEYSRSRQGENRRSQQEATSRTQGETSRGRRSQKTSFEGTSHLEKFFLDQLKDIYYAENKILQSLPKMAEATTTRELKEAFEDHLHQTQRHVKRLEQAFKTINQKAEGKKCEAIEGIAREVEEIINDTEDGTMTRDAALIIAAQKVEHYEIATYGGLVQLAITMNLHDTADLLDKTLVEEEDTDAKLTEIAENEINLGAEHEGSQGSGGEEEEEEDEA